MAIGHREDDIARVLAGKCQLHDLLEGDLLCLDLSGPRIDDDLERLRRPSDPFRKFLAILLSL